MEGIFTKISLHLSVPFFFFLTFILFAFSAAFDSVIPCNLFLQYGVLCCPFLFFFVYIITSHHMTYGAPPFPPQTLSDLL